MGPPLHTRTSGFPGAMDARTQILACRRPNRQCVRRSEFVLLLSADRRISRPLGSTSDRRAANYIVGCNFPRCPVVEDKGFIASDPTMTLITPPERARERQRREWERGVTRCR